MARLKNKETEYCHNISFKFSGKMNFDLSETSSNLQACERSINLMRKLTKENSHISFMG